MTALIILISIIAGSVLADQISKLIVVNTMSVGETVPVIEDVFHFTYIQNRGAAFGMLANNRWVFMIISTVAIIAICVYLFRYCTESMLTKIGFALIVGGGIGNMIDRVILGYVVDMIDCRFIDFYVFNVADSCVCVGAGIVALGFILSSIKDAKAKKAGNSTDDNRE